MSKTVHGPYKAIIVLVLCSGIYGLRINQEDVVTDKFSYNNLDLEYLQLVEPLIANENDVEITPEDDISALTVKAKWNQNGVLEKDTIIGEADDIIKQRRTRQATPGYSPLYPQLPSGPPYNPYQPQPTYNPYSQNPNQQQPSYNPYGQNPNQQQPSSNPSGQNSSQQQPSYNPYGQNPYQQQPSYNSSSQNPNQQQPSYNPYGQNPYQQQPNYNSSSQNPNQQQPNYYPYGQNPNQQQPTFKPAGQTPYAQRPQQWNPNSYNSSQPGNPTHNFNPNTGFHNPNQGPYNPSYNNSSPYRPLNGQQFSSNQTSFTTPWPSYNPRPGQPPFNNNYPPSSGNRLPVQTFNSSSQRTPYFNPSQYPSYNNSRPNPTQWPSSTNSQYPNFPGARPSQGPYNATLPRPQSSPYFPGPSGQFPNNTNLNPNYPSSNVYNPSIPNYPPQNNYQGQSNFFYSQSNNTAYDPRRVPPQNFSYH